MLYILISTNKNSKCPVEPKIHFLRQHACTRARRGIGAATLMLWSARESPLCPEAAQLRAHSLLAMQMLVFNSNNVFVVMRSIWPHANAELCLKCCAQTKLLTFVCVVWVLMSSGLIVLELNLDLVIIISIQGILFHNILFIFVLFFKCSNTINTVH